MPHTITITIKTDNDAFAENPEKEVARILADLGKRMKDSHFAARNRPEHIRDINGNTCGNVIYTPEDDAETEE